jgi:four helix bundle protein
VSGFRCQVSGLRGGNEVTNRNFMDVEDLEVYKKLCRLHIDVCDLTYKWPQEEKYELGSQVRRSSNSAPAQLAEKNDDRHIRNKIEGVNRARGEAAETIHHLFMAKLKGYITEKVYLEIRGRYKECIRMLNGLEKTLERKIPERERRWQLAEETTVYGLTDESVPQGWPITTEHSS